MGLFGDLLAARGGVAGGPRPKALPLPGGGANLPGLLPPGPLQRGGIGGSLTGRLPLVQPQVRGLGKAGWKRDPLKIQRGPSAVLWPYKWAPRGLPGPVFGGRIAAASDIKGAPRPFFLQGLVGRRK